MSPTSLFPAPSLPEVDAFPASARLGSYVPLPSREQVAAYLSAKLLDEPGMVELSGPPGVGKSLMMRVIADRLEDRFVPIRVPIPTLAPDEFATWVRRAALGPGAWRPARLWERFRKRSLPRLLLVEDAQGLPAETAAWIEQWCTNNDGRALLAFTEDFGTRRATTRRAFLEPLALTEIQEYVESHLARIDAPPEVRRLFEGEAARSLALGSLGIPRTIHRLADERLLALAALGGGPLPSEPPAAPVTKTITEAQRGARGDFIAGICGALFLGSMTLSVPSPLSDSPERPQRSELLVSAAETSGSAEEAIAAPTALAAEVERGHQTRDTTWLGARP